mmetsp:Transcript_22116/g.61515  ORF Transcript_22116/g.61515 Transcript_22116/m.61515 type:complete len:382 (+) Transcript_22116:89-1234(+)
MTQLIFHYPSDDKEEDGDHSGIREKLRLITSCRFSSTRDKEECDDHSEMGTESVDLETLPETPSRRKRAETDPAKNTTPDASPRERAETDPVMTDPAKNTTTNASPRRTMNMLTPDMLETLTFTEVEPHTIQFTRASAASPHTFPARTNRNNWNANTRAIANANANTRATTRHIKSVRIDEEQNTQHSPSPKHYRRRKVFSSMPHRNKTQYSHRAHHTRGGSDGGYVSSSSSSSGSSSSSSSMESYEPIPRAPDDWTIEETSENENDDEEENHSLLLPFCSNGSQGCDLLSALGDILSLPIACGILCLDHLMDARLFPKIQKSKKQRRDVMSTESSPRRISRKHRRRFSESDLESMADAKGCEYFPSSIELPVNKVIAPCW